MDVRVAKESYDLVAQVQEDLGPPSQATARYCRWLCPFHADTKPSLTVWRDPQRGWYCFGCGRGGSVFEWFELFYGLDFKTTLAYLDRELPTRPLVQPSQVAATKPSEERKLGGTAWRRWAEQLLDDDEALQFLERKGVRPGTAAAFAVGVNRAYPLGAAITIPWFDREGCLTNLQYRLIYSSNGKRYRWSKGGGSAWLFNWAALESRDVLIVEGAIKAMVLTQAGTPAIAIPNKTGAISKALQQRLSEVLAGHRVYVALDPDATLEAEQLARGIQGAQEVRLMELPLKPDDLQLQLQMTERDWCLLKQQARRVDNKRRTK